MLLDFDTLTVLDNCHWVDYFEWNGINLCL